jgi:hypothetical protein
MFVDRDIQSDYGLERAFASHVLNDSDFEVYVIILEKIK